MIHTVLLVEDELELRELMQEALELNGYRVVAAADGAEALALVSSVERVCLVILDLLMPRMDGWEFCARARSQPQLAGVPIVVHSSSVAEPPAGANGVLRKPVELDQLLSTVRQYCALAAGA